MSKRLVSISRRKDSIAINVNKSATFEETNFAVSHIADFVIKQWARINHMTIEESTEAYLTMLQSYIVKTHRDDYHERQ